jgi:hypothetical protein
MTQPSGQEVPHADGAKQFGGAPGNEQHGPVEILKSIGEVAGALTGLAFITGWLYWSTYYSAFGLNPLELDFSVAVISVSPLQVVLRDWQSAKSAASWAVMGALIGYVVLAVLFVHFRTGSHPRGQFRARALLVALALGMFAGGWMLGRYDANLDSGCFSRLPTVAFLTSAMDPPTDADAAASCLNNELSCKLVLHTKSTYYYFQTPVCGPDSDAPATSGAGFATAELPDSEVRMIRVQRTLGW